MRSNFIRFKINCFRVCDFTMNMIVVVILTMLERAFNYRICCVSSLFKRRLFSGYTFSSEASTAQETVITISSVIDVAHYTILLRQPGTTSSCSIKSCILPLGIQSGTSSTELCHSEGIVLCLLIFVTVFYRLYIRQI